MKKLVSLALCLCLTFALASTAFAADVTTDGTVTYNGTPGGNFTNYDINITAKAENNDEGSTAIDKYSVEIVWGNMEFAWGYPVETQRTWIPETHTWEEKTAEEAGLNKEWYLTSTTELAGVYEGKVANDTSTLPIKTQDAVLVYNHSSLPIDVTFTVDNSVDTVTAANIDATLNIKSTYSAVNAAGAYDLTAAYDTQTGTGFAMYGDNTHAVYGQISLSTPTDPATNLSETAATVAKLTVTIAKDTPATVVTP